MAPPDRGDVYGGARHLRVVQLPGHPQGTEGRCLVLVLVSAVTVATDLAVAVVVGVIVSALVFAWEHAKADPRGTSEEEPPRAPPCTAARAAVFRLGQPLSWSSSIPRTIPRTWSSSSPAPACADHSGLEAIDTLAERYLNAGKTLHLRHLSPECRKLLRKKPATWWRST